MNSEAPETSLASEGLTRRQVLQFGLCGGVSSLLLGPDLVEARPLLSPQRIPHLQGISDIGSMIQGRGWAPKPGLVVSATSDTVYPMLAPGVNASIAQKMVNSIMMRLSGKGTPAKAWGSLFGPGDRVGILIDSVGAPRTRTRKETIGAVLTGLRAAGVNPNQTMIWCAKSGYLPRIGLPINTNRPGVKIFGADQMGWDFRVVLKMKSGLFGTKLPLSYIVTTLCTHIINIATLEDHPVIGARLCLAQQVISSLRGGNYLERRWGGVGISQVARWKIMRQRFVLHMVDGLAGACNGGLHTWHPQIIMAGTDPVALDRLAFGMIEDQRQKLGKPSITGTRRTPRYINNAAANGIGIANLTNIRHQQIRLK